MNIAERDRPIFELSYSYLVDLGVPGVDQALLEKYSDLPDLVERILGKV